MDGDRINDERKKDATRKRRRRRSPPPAAEPAGTASDDEVENFFAIVRNMQIAARMMSRAGKPSSEAAVEGEATKKTRALDWRLAFRLEDFAGVEGANGEIGRLYPSTDERRAEVRKNRRIELRGGRGVSLDLNAAPEAEPEPEGVPG